MKRRLLVPVLGLSAILTTSVVVAETPWYVGAGFAQADTDLSESDLNFLDDGPVFTNIITDGKEKDTAFTIYSGYQIDQDFSVEAGYIVVGSYSASVTTDGSGIAWNAGNPSAT